MNGDTLKKTIVVLLTATILSGAAGIIQNRVDVREIKTSLRYIIDRLNTMEVLHHGSERGSDFKGR